MTDKVLYEADGAIVTITLNDPGMRNPISEAEMVDGIVGALERLNQDKSARVAILTGAGSAFSSGGDLRKMQAEFATRAEKPHLTPLYYKHGIQRIPLAFEKLDVPIIAAVNGPAIGAGLDLACMCDMRIAAETARFAESFVKVGIVPGDGGAWLLPRVVGYSKACEMAFTGDMLTAAEALACGLVSRVVPDADLLAETIAQARGFASGPRMAYRYIKRNLNTAEAGDLSKTLDSEAYGMLRCRETVDHAEAAKAFVEKRKPVFRGR